jgi:hypothetical protein
MTTPFNAAIYAFGRAPLPPTKETPRWTAFVAYEVDGITQVEDFDFNEFDELGEQIETGECWTQIVDITIFYNPQPEDS